MDSEIYIWQGHYVRLVDNGTDHETATVADVHSGQIYLVTYEQLEIPTEEELAAID